MKPLKSTDIIHVIEEYRRAYWEYRNPEFVKIKRYAPLVQQEHKTVVTNGRSFTVSLYDSWIDIGMFGGCLIGKEPTPVAQYTDHDLQIALEALLDYTRIQFTNDDLFNKILDLEYDAVKTKQNFVDAQNI